MIHSRYRLPAVVVLLMTAACQTAAPNTDPVTALNGLFHEQYAATREGYSSRLGTEEHPLLLMTGNLTLRWKGQSTNYPVLRPRYHTLKGIAHTALATYVALLSGSGSGSTLPEDTRARLRRMRELIAAVRKALEDPSSPVRSAVPPELLGEQRTLLSASDAIISEALAQGRPSADRLARFAQAVRPAIIANARGAARDELEQLDRQVTAIRGLLGPEQWKHVVVVIGTVRQARARETSLQYFERVLGEPAAGEGASRESRIVVLEQFGSTQPLEVMGLHELDQDIAAGLLGDPLLLQSDLMGPYAAEYLTQMSLE